MNELKLFVQTQNLDEILMELKSLSYTLRKGLARQQERDEATKNYSYDIIEKKVVRIIRKEIRAIFREMIRTELPSTSGEVKEG